MSWLCPPRRSKTWRYPPRARRTLPNFAIPTIVATMTTMNISLPESLKAFVDEQVGQCGYGTSSEYVRELIRREQDRVQLRNLLLAGAASPPTAAVDPAYFEGLRARVRKGAKVSRNE
jgi:antitoxin ParD1/3/4